MKRRGADRAGSAGAPADELVRILASVRRRWRLRIVLRGAAVTLGVALVAFGISAWAVDAARFSPGVVGAVRWVAWGSVVVAALAFLARPLLRRVGDEQVALYLEEHEPSLEAAILGAVAVRDSETSPTMLEGLVRRAVERARGVEGGRRIERRALTLHGSALAALTSVALLALLFGPASLRTGATALLPTRSAEAVNPYRIGVQPGDVRIARGSDQFVSARLQGFTTDEVSLFTRDAEGAPWQRLTMVPAGPSEGVGPGDGADVATMGGISFELLLLNLEADTDYFVEADGVRSPTFRIEVADLPYVASMRHEYRFPAYTGLEPRLVEDAGDVVALRGSTVRMEITSTLPSPQGRLVLDDGSEIALERLDDGTFVAELPVREEGFYRVELGMDDGTLVEASPEYAIDLLSDGAPMIRMTEPGRDTPASPIEEVYLEAEASDDYGVRDVLLVWSVNGAAEDTTAIYRDAGGPPLEEVTAGHTLYLEDYEVEPGDVVSYYAVARDQQGAAAEVVSDIYFLDIRPFGQEFREAPQQGGGGGGGGGGEAREEGLSELQRQVVAATFNLERDRERYDDDEFREGTAAVALAQGRVREQVTTLVTRMQARGLTRAEDEFRRIAEMLPEAMESMDSARVRLERGDTRGALGPEQEALRVLQKAEASYEVYVSRSPQQGGGGGGGNQANAEDLADLFELELDRLQNQYETVERGRQREQAEEVDELMQKLDELARRQQQEMERQRARSEAGAAQGRSGGAAGGRSQRELADETEETARQLQRLARDRNDRQLEETARDLQEAARAMREAAARGGNQSAGESARAAERLAEAQRRLGQARERRVQDDAAGAMERVERLQARQEELTRRVGELADDPRDRGEEVRRIQQEKTEMAGEVGELEQTLDRLAADARRDDPGAARELGEAAEAIREARLSQKILWSRGVVEQREREFAEIFERGLEEDLELLRKQMTEASDAAQRLGQGRDLEDALDQARQLVRGAESLGRRLEQRPGEPADGEAGQADGEEGRTEPGQEGRSAEGQGGEGRGRDSGRTGTAGAGSPGQPAPGGRPGDGGAVRGDPTRPISAEEARQYAREYRERFDEARALRDALRAQDRDTQELDRALAALDRLRRDETFGDLQQVRALQAQLRETLGRIEFILRREVEGEGVGRAALQGSDDVPPEYRALVEEYYRNLSRGGGGD
jgi:hypothetical protein